MQMFHVSKNQTIEKYATIAEANRKSQESHERFMQNLSFDIKQFEAEHLTAFYFNYNLLSLKFSNGLFLNTLLEQHDHLVLSTSDRAIQCQPFSEHITFKYVQGDYAIWDPLENLTYFIGMRFDKIYLNNNWFFFYFRNAEYVLSVTLLNIEESPQKLIYWEKSL